MALIITPNFFKSVNVRKNKLLIEVNADFLKGKCSLRIFTT